MITSVTGPEETSATRERARPLTPDDRREAILDAVVPMLRERGRDVSTREMAEAAEVAEGTLFRAFGDKDSLVAAAVERIFDPAPLWARLRAIDPQQSSSTKLRTLVSRLRAHYRDVVTAVIALGHRKRPSADDTARSRRELAAIVGELFAHDRGALAVSVETVADYVRLVAFAASMPMTSSDFDDDALSDLVAYGTFARTGDR